MSIYTVFRLDNGVFTGMQLHHDQADMDAMLLTPLLEGCGVLQGNYNWRTQRLDIESGEVVPYTPPPPAPEVLAAAARAERDRRLAACDWVTARALDLGQPVPEPWRAYRAALRDISAQAGWPAAIDWPVSP